MSKRRDAAKEAYKKRKKANGMAKVYKTKNSAVKRELQFRPPGKKGSMLA